MLQTIVSETESRVWRYTQPFRAVVQHPRQSEAYGEQTATSFLV